MRIEIQVLEIDQTDGALRLIEVKHCRSRCWVNKFKAAYRARNDRPRGPSDFHFRTKFTA